MVVTPDGNGKKADDGKNRLDLVPPDALLAVGQVLTYGANKYGERNWERGMKWGRVFGAALRHMWAWWAGEKNDPETGLPHLWHAATCLMFLIAYEVRNVGTDDRNLIRNNPQAVPTRGEDAAVAAVEATLADLDARTASEIARDKARAEAREMAGKLPPRPVTS